MNMKRLHKFLARLPAVSTVLGRRKDTIQRFHQIYYQSRKAGGTWRNTYWLGVQTAKCPLDLWILQEIAFELRPDLIIETGTYKGGSALYLASVLDSIGSGSIVTIDIEKRDDRPAHPRIEYMLGSSLDPEILSHVGRRVRPADNVMVILDSDHEKEHVLREMKAYCRFVSPGSYLVVEDTNINGHPVCPGHGPGPMEAVAEFLQKETGFVVDSSREKFLLTFNPSGYLRRVR